MELVSTEAVVVLFPAKGLLPYKNSNKLVFVQVRRPQLKCVMCFLFNHSASFVTYLFVGAGRSCAMVHIWRTRFGSGSKFSPGLVASVLTCYNIWLPPLSCLTALLCCLTLKLGRCFLSLAASSLATSGETFPYGSGAQLSVKSIAA